MRCFVGLWPDALSGARLSRLADELHARYPRAKRVADHNLHVTLAFIGELDATSAASVSSALEAFQIADDVWRLESLGAFPRARVLWAGSEPNEALAQLASDVRSTLGRLGVRFDPKPFAAHITLLRNFPPQDARTLRRPIEPPIDFRLGRPALIVSTAGPHGTRYCPFGSNTV